MPRANDSSQIAAGADAATRAACASRCASDAGRAERREPSAERPREAATCRGALLAFGRARDSAACRLAGLVGRRLSSARLAVAGQRFGQRDDRLRDRGLGRLLDQRHAVVAHFDHRAIVVGQLPEDLAADRLLGLLQADLPLSRPTRLTTILTLSLIASIWPNDIISRTTLRRQGRSSCVTSRMWLAISKATMSIGAVALRQVDDQVRERGLQQADHAPQVVGRDQGHVFQLHRPRQQVQARGVLGQRALEQREVEPRDVLGDVDQRVVGNRVEEHVGVAQAQVEVDQGHGVLADRPPGRSPG